LLFNIAQSHRQLHQWEPARFNYRQYLNLKPDAPNRAEVEELIGQMQRRIDEEREQQTRVPRDQTVAKNTDTLLPAPPKPAAPAAAVAPAPAEPSGHPLRWAGYAALGTGAAVEVVAFLMHSSAQSAADQFNQK